MSGNDLKNKENPWKARLEDMGLFGRQSKEPNLLVKGDCLLGMTLLQDRLEGQVRLVYADPPYNTGAKGREYDDHMDPDEWIEMLESRMSLASNLLSDDGWLFLHLDSTGIAEAKVMLDRVMGRDNFAYLVTWERTPKITFLGQGSSPLIRTTEFLLVYSKEKRKRRMNRLVRKVDATERVLSQYDLVVTPGKAELLFQRPGPSGEPMEVFRHQGFEVFKVPMQARLARFQDLYQSTRINPSSTLLHRLAKELDLDVLHSVRYTPARGKRAGRRIEVFLYKGRQLWPARENAEVMGNRIFRTLDLSTLWTNQEISAVGISSEGGVKLVRGKKPERLLERIVMLATDPGDLVLDLFAGSGTTAAVAHKLGRRWVVFEISDAAETKVLPRMEKVVSGHDKSGIPYLVPGNSLPGFNYIRVVTGT